MKKDLHNRTKSNDADGADDEDYNDIREIVLSNNKNDTPYTISRLRS